MAIPVFIAGAIVAGVGATAAGVSAGVKSKKKRKALEAQAKQMEELAASYRDAVVAGEMTLGDMLGRIDTHMSKVGGQLKQWYDNQMALGTELIQSNFKSSIDQINFGIEQAKTRADRAERSHLEEKQRQLDRLEKDFDRSNQEIANQAIRRRLGGSGAFMAAIGKSQETLGRVKNELERTSNQALRSIGEQLTDVIAAGGFQTLQAQAQANRGQLGLQQQVGGQFSQQQMALEQAGFGAREGAFEKALTHKLNEEQIRQQGKGFDIQADAVSPAADIFAGIGGGLTGIGTSLMSK